MNANPAAMDFSLYAFELPLRQPLSTSHGQAIKLRGLLASITDEHGHIGWGQSMELPQAAPEVLAAELAQHRQNPEPTEVLEFPDCSSQPTHTAIALDQAWYDLQARQQNQPLWQWLNPNQTNPPSHLPLNALISGGSATTDTGAGAGADVVQAAQQATDQGYPAVKLKVGAANWETELATIAQVRQAVGPEVALRLDANGAWDLPTAQARLAQLECYDIDYIEEPVSALEQLAELAATSPVPIAADESIQGLAGWRQAIQLASQQKLAALVVKPTTVGHLTGVFQLLAADPGFRLVVTSALDSSLGLACAAHFAAALSSCEPCGLDTAQLLAADLCQPPLTSSQGQLSVPAGSGLGVAPHPPALAKLSQPLARGQCRRIEL